MRMMRCKACSKIEGKEKLLVPNFDFLVKHAWLRKCITIQREVIIATYFLNSTNAHVKNEKLYVTIGFDIIFAQIVMVGKVEKKKKCSSLQSSNCSSKATQ
jgi:hypothetical protein